MKKFNIHGTFEAHDIGDAVAWLGAHFLEVWTQSRQEDDEPKSPYIAETRTCHFVIGPQSSEGGDGSDITDPA
jgi:hypothetical protein